MARAQLIGSLPVIPRDSAENVLVSGWFLSVVFDEKIGVKNFGGETGRLKGKRDPPCCDVIAFFDSPTSREKR